MSTKVKVRKETVIPGYWIGLRANCKGPQGSDMPRAPWSNFQCIRCPGPMTLKLGGGQWFSPHEKTYFVVLVLEVVFRGNHCREDTGTKYRYLRLLWRRPLSTLLETNCCSPIPGFLFYILQSLYFAVFVVRYNTSKYKKNYKYKYKYKCKRNERLIMALTNAKNTKNIAV